MANVVPGRQADSRALRRAAGTVVGFVVSAGLIRLILSLGVRRVILGLGVAAAGTIATLTLTGTVTLQLEITVTPTPAADNLDLTVDLPRTKVADLLVLTNSPSGYEVTVRSESVLAGDCSAPCLHSVTTNQSLGYLLYRGTTQIGFSGDRGTFVQAFAKSIPGGDSYEVGISYAGTGVNLSPANNYGEILTFSVAIN